MSNIFGTEQPPAKKSVWRMLPPSQDQTLQLYGTCMTAIQQIKLRLFVRSVVKVSLEVGHQVLLLQLLVS